MQRELHHRWIPGGADGEWELDATHRWIEEASCQGERQLRRRRSRSGGGRSTSSALIQRWNDEDCCDSWCIEGSRLARSSDHTDQASGSDHLENVLLNDFFVAKTSWADVTHSIIDKEESKFFCKLIIFSLTQPKYL